MNFIFEDPSRSLSSTHLWSNKLSCELQTIFLHNICSHLLNCFFSQVSGHTFTDKQDRDLNYDKKTRYDLHFPKSLWTSNLIATHDSYVHNFLWNIS